MEMTKVTNFEAPTRLIFGSRSYFWPRAFLPLLRLPRFQPTIRDRMGLGGDERQQKRHPPLPAPAAQEATKNLSTVRGHPLPE